MRRLAIALTLLLVLAALVPSPALFAKAPHPPHQNPGSAALAPDVLPALVLLGNAFERAAEGKLPDARDLLQGLEKANLPQDLRYLVDRYQSLANGLLAALSELEARLEEASRLLADYRLKESKEKLEVAVALVPRTQLLLTDLETAGDRLKQQMRIPFLSPRNELRQAFERLAAVQQRVRALTDRLTVLSQSLGRQQEAEKTRLAPTELSLSPSPEWAWLGDRLIAAGRLTAGGQALPGRRVALLWGESSLSLTTSPDGSYLSELTLPYKYAPAMTLEAKYRPSGEDVGRYQGSNTQVNLPTIFFPTTLELAAPRTAAPGLATRVSGRVEGPQALPRTVQVLLDDQVLAETATAGTFSTSITPPLTIAPGGHALTVRVGAWEQYAGASRTMPLVITRLPVSLGLQAPQISLAPGQVTVSGRVSGEAGTPGGAEVKVTLKESRATGYTSADGGFTIQLSLPPEPSLAGPQTLSLAITPREPWFAPQVVRQSVFIINPASLGVMLVIFLAAGIIATRRIKTGTLLRDGAGVTVVPPPGTLPVAAPPVPRPGLAGARGRAVTAYFEAVREIEKAGRLSMSPDTTLREYLKRAASSEQQSAIIPAFSELTSLAELALYSAHPLDEASAARAEELLAAIGGGLA